MNTFRQIAAGHAKPRSRARSTSEPILDKQEAHALPRHLDQRHVPVVVPDPPWQVRFVSQICEKGVITTMTVVPSLPLDFQNLISLHSARMSPPP